MGALLIFLVLLNFGISWWNAYVCGKVWCETKAAGGWRRFMTWMGAIMSASGFTWCYLIFLAFAANYFGYIDNEQMNVSLELGFIIIWPGILFSGLMITIDSWARAFREGGVLNYGVATYNTFAQVHNTLSGIQTMGHALSDVGDYFSNRSGSSSSSSEDEGKTLALLVVIAIVVLAVVGGILTTTLIIKRTAARDPLLSIEEMRRRQATA